MRTKATATCAKIALRYRKSGNGHGPSLVSDINDPYHLIRILTAITHRLFGDNEEFSPRQRQNRVRMAAKGRHQIEPAKQARRGEAADIENGKTLIFVCHISAVPIGDDSMTPDALFGIPVGTFSPGGPKTGKPPLSHFLHARGVLHIDDAVDSVRVTRCGGRQMGVTTI